MLAKTLGVFAAGDYHPCENVNSAVRAKGQNMSFNMRYPGLRQALPWVLMAIFIAMLLPQSAVAQVPPSPSPQQIFGLFGTEYGDAFSSVFLNQIFGPLFPSPTPESGATVFSHLIGYFNTVVVVIGGLLFFWNVTVGILTTAHEGKLLGQRWSSLWAMPRVIFAIGLMVPLSGLGGYNVAQAGVGYIVRASTNIASELWKNGARLVINGEIPITTEAASIDPQTLTTMYEMAACMVIVEDQLAKAGGGLSIGKNTQDFASGKQVINTVVVGGESSYSPGICGTIHTPDSPQYLLTLSEEPLPGGAITGLPQNASVRSQASAAFHDMHKEVADTLWSEMLALARANHAAAVDPSLPLPNFEAKVRELMHSTSATMREGINNVVDLVLDNGGGAGGGRQAMDARNALLSRIEGGSCTDGAGSDDAAMACLGEGWIGAGSWYMVLARLNNELTSLTTARITAETGTYIKNVPLGNRDLYVASNGRSFWSDDVANARDAGMITSEEAELQMARHKQALANSTAGLAALGFSMSMENLSELNETINAEGVLGKIPGFKEWFFSFMNSVIGLGSPNGAFGSADPMIGIINIGNMLTYASGLFMVASVAGGFISGGGTATVLAPVIAVLMLSGGTLAFILPMTPFLFWILAVTGYFLLVVEAVIAVNLWALAHMRLDGDGISGEAGKQGWLMLLSLFMTPSLMIFGFFIGMQIFRVTTTLIDMMFSQAFAGIYNGNLYSGFILMFVYAIVIAVMYMTLIERSFSLVTEFPGKVMRWMGATADITNGDETRARMAMAAGGGALLKGSSHGASVAKNAASHAGVSETGGGRGADGRARGGYMYRRRENGSGASNPKVKQGEAGGSNNSGGGAETPRGNNEDRTGPRAGG